MNIRNLLITAITFFCIGLNSGCKKENRIEKNLWKNGGEWNVESATISETSSNPVNNSTETIYNYGTLIFKKEGTCVLTTTLDGDTDVYLYVYSNTEDKLRLTADNDPIVFDMKWEKDKIELSITETSAFNGEIITTKESLNLKKK